MQITMVWRAIRVRWSLLSVPVSNWLLPTGKAAWTANPPPPLPPPNFNPRHNRNVSFHPTAPADFPLPGLWIWLIDLLLACSAGGRGIKRETENARKKKKEGRWAAKCGLIWRKEQRAGLGLDPARTSFHTCSIVCLASTSLESKGVAICSIMPFFSEMPWGFLSSQMYSKGLAERQQLPPSGRASLLSWLICRFFKLTSSGCCFVAKARHGHWGEGTIPRLNVTKMWMQKANKGNLLIESPFTFHLRKHKASHSRS